MEDRGIENIARYGIAFSGKQEEKEKQYWKRNWMIWVIRFGYVS